MFNYKKKYKKNIIRTFFRKFAPNTKISNYIRQMAFKIKRKISEYPELYPKVERKLATVSEMSKTVVGGFKLRHKVDYIPQKGLQEDICTSECNLIFMCGQATSGKAQPYDAKVLTPYGFVDMGSLRIGDPICGVDGKVQTVLNIFEQGEKDVFRLTFDDGASTECCGEHLWKVYRKTSHNSFSQPYIVQLSDMLTDMSNNKNVRYAIPMTSAVEFPKQELPIDPYLLGLMLGDGHIRKNKSIFTSADEECVNAFINAGYRVSKRFGNNYDYNISGKGFNQHLMELGLTGVHSNSKFVPDLYKRSSITDRIALIQGLLDTDGTVDKIGHIAFYTVSQQLAKDMQWLIRSIGGRCSITHKHTKYTYKGQKKNGQLCYVLNLYTPHNPLIVRLPRKKERLFDGFRHGKAELRRRLIKVELSGRKQCRCILVSNPDHLYITDDFIVTHNTFSMFLKALQGIDKQDFKARLISVRALDSKKGSSMFADGVKVCGNFAGCQYNSSDVPTFLWPQYNSTLQLIHSNFNYANPDEKKLFEDYAKKQQASLIMIDEATEMNHFGMFAYWFMRNRDDSGMIPQMILSFNPLYEHWTTIMLRDAGYLGSDWYLKPEMIGKVRYFYVKGDTPESIVWGDTREEVVAVAKPRLSKEDIEAGITIYDLVKSFTVFTGTAADNRELVNATSGQSVANLHAVGGTQRSIVGEAYFGPIERDEVNVNHKMIHDLWDNPVSDDTEMYATLDVSGGNTDSDNCPMCVFRGNSLIAIKMFHGNPKQLVEWIDRILKQYRVPIENFAFDATGIGNYLRAYTSGVPLTANRRPIQEMDERGNAVNLDMYYNLRSQLLARMEVALQKGELNFAIPRDMIIPYGKKGETRKVIDILFDEMNVLQFTTRNNKRYAKSKDEYKARYHASPDLLDALTLVMYFFLNPKPKKKAKQMVDEDAYNELYRRPPKSSYVNRANFARRGFYF